MQALHVECSLQWNASQPNHPYTPAQHCTNKNPLIERYAMDKCYFNVPDVPPCTVSKLGSDHKRVYTCPFAATTDTLMVVVPVPDAWYPWQRSKPMTFKVSSLVRNTLLAHATFA